MFSHDGALSIVRLTCNYKCNGNKVMLFSQKIPRCIARVPLPAANPGDSRLNGCPSQFLR